MVVVFLSLIGRHKRKALNNPMQKGQILIFLLVGILVIGVAGGAFYLGRSTIQKPLPTPSTASQTPQPNPTPSEETANWKTYTNNQLHYSIKYPNDQFINCGKDDFLLYKGREATRGCPQGEEIPAFTISTHGGSGYSLETSQYPECYSVKKETINVGGLPATKYSNQIIDDPSSKCSNTVVSYAKSNVTILLNHGTDLLIYSFYENADKDIKNKMLSTFKFTQ